MLKNVIAALTIGLILSGCTTQTIEWEAKPYSPDHYEQGIYRTKTDHFVGCEEPAIDEYICFHHTNIAELKAELDKINMTEELKLELDAVFERIMRKLKK